MGSRALDRLVIVVADPEPTSRGTRGHPMKKTVVSIAAGTPAPALAGCVVTDENGMPIDGGGVTPATPWKA